MLVVALILVAALATRASADDDDIPPDDAADFARPGARTMTDDTRDELADSLSTASSRTARRTLAPCNCDRDDVARIIASAPDLADVVSAAQRAAGVADDPTKGWRRRSRWAALVPWITVRAGNNQSWREVADPTISQSASYGAAFAWRLDRLIYDPNEPRLATQDIARRRERRRVAQLASRAYFAWVEATAAASRDSRWQLQAYEAHAELDALTDGWFTRETGP